MLPLLRTKISIPPARQNRVERSRLMERVSEGMKRALTLVVAPAGFGKTTLMAEWAQSASMPVAWLSLEHADCTTERFLSYLIHALQKVSPQTGQTALAILHSGQTVPDETILFALLNDLSETSSDFALILDDYHNVDGAEINAVVQFLLEHRPAQMHFGITSRVMPGMSLARLRALDQVIEVNATDLRFNDIEMHTFLEQMGARLTPDQTKRLNQSVEGWAVGLQLAGITLAHQPFDWNIPAGQAHIFDYLAEEVLRRESPEVQEFLKVSALFDRFNTSIIDYVTRNTYHVIARPAADLLSHIERSNLFITPLDSSGTWFRYHALFADFLRRQQSPEQTSPLYRAASLWLEQNGLLDDAIHYATHAADIERAANLLEDHYRDMIQRGEQAALLDWIAAMPPELLDVHPRLWLARGWGCIISLDSAQAQACAEKAEALIPADETTNRPALSKFEGLRGEAKSLRILSGIFAGKPAAADEISEAFVLLAEQDDFLHSLLHFNLGLHHVMLGNTTQALDAFAETLPLTKSLNNPLVFIFANVQMGEVRQMRGALGLAERTFQQVIQYTRETLGKHTFLLGMPFVSYADLLREQNRFDEAIRYAEQGIAYCQVWQPVASMDGHIALARLNAARGNWDEAFACLERAMQVAESSVSILDDTFVATQLARLALLQGNIPKAMHYIKVYDLDKAGEGMYYHLWEMTQLALLRTKALSLETDPGPALSLVEALSTLIAEAERRERVTPVIEALILRTYAQHAAAQHANAAEDLSHALTLGAQSGYVRIFADEGKQLLHLIEQYRPRLHAPRAYVKEIHNLIHKELAAQSSLPKLHWDNVSAVEGQPPQQLMPLTRRELDILHLLAAGKSNQEIAEERVLTLNTIKKHVANILLKLGVANRTQAVMMARKSGWME
ncbi:MAG: LuxR C-terminal-related transcriptional regulator [Anaerolineales bacterium]|nr:LuxR C-terminal-related transcriptional regulator [Anaerolineales bacterium]